jgi:hypothetical protein
MCIFTQSDWLNKQSNENLPENGNNSDYSSIQELSSDEIEIEGKNANILSDRISEMP